MEEDHGDDIKATTWMNGTRLQQWDASCFFFWTFKLVLSPKQVPS
jgi:hypothetical protein